MSWLSSYGVTFVKLKGIKTTLNLLINKKDTGQTEFDRLYDDFSKIYSGEIYKNLTKDTILENKFDKTQSFRLNLLRLYTKTLKFIKTTVTSKIPWEKTEYNNHNEYYIERLNRLKTAYPTMLIYPTFNNKWPSKISTEGADTNCSNEQLILIYKIILKPDIIRFKLNEDALFPLKIGTDFLKEPFKRNIEKTDDPADVYNDEEYDEEEVEDPNKSLITPVKNYLNTPLNVMNTPVSKKMVKD